MHIDDDRFVVEEHTVIESKPNHFLDDLRLNSSWPELRSFAETIDLNVANSVVHKHTPYVIILLKVADEWPKTHGGSLPSTREEKKEFKELVRARMRAMDEDNYKEAVKVSFKVFAPRGITAGLLLLVCCCCRPHG
ncbi:NEDD8-activating enzyme E1 regulatory subunit AXR1-like isoform X2 [Camellia sinensis]|uniref:NEDD8-activating enzyme E1 regulatory subunit AXR1-like isoform X2 n=1 Tax=Camellia sinensis TaxID=4442 RepID=UPI0010366105|nr:NEDD8-activating enzyme E1 regulatory subunit AXR1-like isoform X2 [Camellia sinensis]XP_028123328.1 NEDD8-activating enzyme E1 regulatory subunit AXR1-like isoform X2 [Camellia sinensis]